MPPSLVPPPSGEPQTAPLLAEPTEQLYVVGPVDVHVPGLWQGSLGMHETGFDPTQTPLELHVSVCVQPLLSLQDAPVATGLEHVPVVGSQIPAEWH
jgi:hypothetical protein